MLENNDAWLSLQGERVLPNGVILTSVLKDGFCDIRDGRTGKALNLPEDPNLVAGWGGEASERILLTGEQIVFPPAFSTNLILGRGGGSDVEIDVDLTPVSEAPTSWGAKDAKELLEIYSMYQALKKDGVKFALEAGDLGIHKKALLLNYDPRVEVLVATWDSSFDPPLDSSGKIIGDQYRLQSILPGAYVLAKSSDNKPVLHKMATYDGSGSRIIRDGEVIIIPGLRKYVALRYFAAGEGKPARLVKCSFASGENMTPEGEEKFIREKISEFIFSDGDEH
jgi:hypothetical protein